MAVFARTRLVNNWIDREKVHDSKRLRDALYEGGSDGAKSLSNIMGVPDFIIEGTTDTNTAALDTGAANSIQVNLSTEGVTFPTDTVRMIDIMCETRDGALRNFQHIRQFVLGGANPTLVRGVQNMGPSVGGQVTFATAAATAAHAFGDFTITSAATATGRYAAAVPGWRRLITKACNLSLVGTGDLTAVGTTANLNAGTASSGVIELGIRAGAQENVAPADTVVLDVLFDHLPIANPELAVVTTTSPDQIVVGAVGESSDVVSWYTRVFISEAIPSTLL